jgi:MFS family permease
LSTWEQIAISAFWLGTNALWGALLLVMLPSEVDAIAPIYRVPAVGLLASLAAFIALVVPLIAGALSDRCASSWGRRRPFIGVGVAVNVVGLALMYLAYSSRQPLTVGDPVHEGTFLIYTKLLGHGSFVIFLLAYMIVQLGNNIATAAYSGVIPDLVPEDQRGRASGYMALMSQGGTLIGAIGCGKLLGHSPEAVKYAVLALFLVGAALVTIFGIKETALPVPPTRLAWIPYIKSLWINPKVYPDFAWVWITRALVMLGFYGILPFVNFYFIDVIGVKKDDAGGTASMLTALILVAASISAVYGGNLSDRIGRKRVVYFANSMIALMCVVFIFCRTIPEVMAAGFFFGLGFGAYTSVDWALGTDVLPTKSNAAKEMAVWHISMTLPQSIGAWAAAYLIGLFVVNDVADSTIVHYKMGGYTALFSFAAVCFGLGAVLLRNVKGVK